MLFPIAFALSSTLPLPQQDRYQGIYSARFGDRAAKVSAPSDDGRTDPEVGRALDRAAWWLAEHQRSDGSWGGDVEDTSLALMALVAAGHRPDVGALKQATRAAEAWLRHGARARTATRERALATLALAELWEVAPRPEAREELAGLALDEGSAPTFDAPEDRAWRVLALMAAEDRGVAVPVRTVVRALDEFDTARTEVPLAASALELAARLAAGQSLGAHPELGAQTAELEALARGLAATESDVVLYASVALRQLGGERWETWRAALQPTLLSLQGDDGSWPVSAAASQTRRTARLALALALDTRAPRARAVLQDLGAAPADARGALDAAARWLLAAQAPEGYWRAGDGRANDRVGPGDIGVTGLALSALVHGAGEAEAGAAARAAAWLLSQQDPDTGLLGERLGHAFHYDHALATLALLEWGGVREDAATRAALQAAVDYIHRARNPYGAWRYDCPPIGDNDTSVTGWMTSALLAARDAGFRVDVKAFEGANDWVAAVTDPETGRVGYDSVGSRSSRVVSVNEAWPTEKAEAMTAVGLWLRTRLDANFRASELCARQARLIASGTPRWEPGSGCDMVAWMVGTRALRALGGEEWSAWSNALLDVACAHQRRDGEEAGSWDPVGPWGPIGGRAYATAMMALALSELEAGS